MMAPTSADLHLQLVQADGFANLLTWGSYTALWLILFVISSILWTRVYRAGVEREFVKRDGPTIHGVGIVALTLTTSVFGVAFIVALLRFMYPWYWIEFLQPAVYVLDGGKITS